MKCYCGKRLIKCPKHNKYKICSCNELNKIVYKKIKEAVKHKNKIYNDLSEIVNELNLKFEGIDNMIKSKKSLKRKIILKKQ